MRNKNIFLLLLVCFLSNILIYAQEDPKPVEQPQELPPFVKKIDPAKSGEPQIYVLDKAKIPGTSGSFKVPPGSALAFGTHGDTTKIAPGTAIFAPSSGSLGVLVEASTVRITGPPGSNLQFGKEITGTSSKGTLTTIIPKAGTSAIFTIGVKAGLTLGPAVGHPPIWIENGGSAKVDVDGKPLMQVNSLDGKPFTFSPQLLSYDVPGAAVTGMNRPGEYHAFTGGNKMNIEDLSNGGLKELTAKGLGPLSVSWTLKDGTKVEWKDVAHAAESQVPYSLPFTVHAVSDSYEASLDENGPKYSGITYYPTSYGVEVYYRDLDSSIFGGSDYYTYVSINRVYSPHATWRASVASAFNQIYYADFLNRR